MSEATAAGIDHMRRGPLDGMALPDDPAFSIQVAPPSARALLRAGPDLVAAAAPVLGLALPTTPNSVARDAAGERMAIWLGPDEWLLLAPPNAALPSALDATLATVPHSLVDVSHRQVALTVEGQLVARVLSAGCPLDLRLPAFPVGMATRTIFAKTEIVLWRQAEAHFHVEVWRSFAPYLVGHLREALVGAHGLGDARAGS
jgi:sarcosine oxidase subunit gamma